MSKNSNCGCRTSLPSRDERNEYGMPITATRMIVCEQCGNKRCPHATDHYHACTNSNEPGQGKEATMREKISLRSTFDVAVTSDTHIILIDRDDGMSVTNDACAVIPWLDAHLDGGIGNRKTYYLDTAGRFDELLAEDGQFAGFLRCTPGQQESLSLLVAQAKIQAP